MSKKCSKKKCSKCGALLSQFMTTYKKGVCENCDGLKEVLRANPWLRLTDFS